MSTSCHRLPHLPLATWPAALTVCSGKSIRSANLEAAYCSNEIPMSLLHLQSVTLPLPRPFAHAVSLMLNDDEYEQQPRPRAKRNEQKGRQRKKKKERANHVGPSEEGARGGAGGRGKNER